jgi:hypothetical protein
MAEGHTDAHIYAEAAARVMDIYRRRVEGHAGGENGERVRQADLIETQLRLAALSAEREKLFALARAHVISDDTARKLVRDIDLLEERFRAEAGRSLSAKTLREQARAILKSRKR